MYTHNQRPAIAMLELIFAIVIMGIVLMSAPMFISTATQSSIVALQQEGISEAVSRVSMVQTYPWDEADTNDSCIPPVLHVTNGDSELDMVANDRRVGVPLDSSSRTFICGTRNDFNASAIGTDTGETENDDIDDFDGSGTVLQNDSSGTGGKDYLDTATISISTSITYLSDAANYSQSSFAYAPAGGSATSNIKEIDVTLTGRTSNSELAEQITLKAFSCNIGGREFEYKVIP